MKARQKTPTAIISYFQFGPVVEIPCGSPGSGVILRSTYLHDEVTQEQSLTWTKQTTLMITQFHADKTYVVNRYAV
jgi:hypothetical protein